jgi:glycosyltransferase involved in cell wall biosynthesis
VRRLYYIAYSPLDLQSANSLQTFNTTRALARQLGHRLTVIVPRFGDEREPPFPAVRLRRLPVNKLSRLWPSGWWGYWERQWYGRRAGSELGGFRREEDLIYTRDLMCACELIGRGFPVFYEVHDLEASHPGLKSERLKKWLQEADLRALTGARGVASLTEAFRTEVIARKWQDASRVFVIPDAYDDAIFFPRDKQGARKTLGIDQDAPVVAYAGLTFRYRGLDLLVRAMGAWNDPRAQLILVGGRPFEIPELQELAARAGIADRVTFLGRQPPEEVAKVLAAADTLVIPDSVTDDTASPLKMFEYMAMARPIVSVDRPSLREIMGETAIYYPRGNVPVLASALARAIAPEGAALGERARLRVADHTYTRRAERIVSAAEALLS